MCNPKEVKEKYYYLRDGQNRPLVTVCIAKDKDGSIGRGIALCSNSDNPCKAEGKKWARKRAIRALGSKTNNNNITSYKALTVIEQTESEPLEFDRMFEGSFGEIPKSYFNPDLTEYESKLIGKM